MSVLSRKVTLFPAVFLAAWVLGCGSGTTNNDQGVSFSATSFCEITTDVATATEGSLCPNGPQLSEAILPVSTDGNTLFGDGQVFAAGLAFQNYLTQQRVRVVRVDCTTEIPGSSISIPRDSHPIGIVLPEATFVPTGSGNPDATPPSTPSEGSAEFTVISTDFYSFLNVNRNSLPALPFRAFVTCSGVGVTTAGDTLTTNPLTLPITFVDRRQISGAVSSSSAVTTGIEESLDDGSGVTGDGTTDTGSSDDGLV